MIKPLTKDNDKINMIPIIKLINERIKLFFKKNNDNNIININGSWGTGKSTIINNLETFYEEDNTKWIVINLWEYEVIDNPYYNIIQDILSKIIHFHKQVDNQNQEQKAKEKYSKIKSLLKKIKSINAGIKFIDPITGLNCNPYIQIDLDTFNAEKQDLETIIKDATDEIKELVKFSKKNIIIIFDELDRCIPDNQIKFLSYIKNIFLKINNIFYLVASNNEIVNSSINKLLIEKDNVSNERYTDKLFSVTINLKDIFFSENMSFTKNHYIQEFIKRVRINNPRFLNKILIQTNGILDNIKNFELFSFLKDDKKENWKKIAIERLEFIIFYIKYIKFRNYSDYNDIIKFIDITSIEWESLLENFKNIAKNWKQIMTKPNSEIFEFILKNKEIIFSNPDWSKTSQFKWETVYFCIKNNNSIIPIWFSALIPFLGAYIIKENNLNHIFTFKSKFSNEEELSQLLYEIQYHNYKEARKIYNDVHITLVLLQIEKLNIPDYLKQFMNILFKDFDTRVYILEEFKITFDTMKILIEESIFDY